MTKREKEILWDIIDDVTESDDKIEVLERLYFEVREMIGYKFKDSIE